MHRQEWIGTLHIKSIFIIGIIQSGIWYTIQRQQAGVESARIHQIT